MADTVSVGKTNVSTSADSLRSVADVDADLVERVKAGEMAAFDELTAKYRDRLFGVVYNMLSNKEDAMDIVQESFIKAFTSIKSFRGNSAFYTWLYRIAVNRSITFLKRSRMRRFFSFENMEEELGSSEIVDKLVERQGNGRRAALVSELRDKLNEAVQSLSVNHRTVVVLYEIDGMSHAEIAEITKTSEATVRTRLHYAKQQLRAILKDYVS